MFEPQDVPPEELKIKIKKLLKEKDVFLLSHNYQRDEIQEIADLTGDSLALSQAARQVKEKTIVFCGVHFMAESAAILAPDKTVLLPKLEAGCPMADMITVEDLIQLKKKYPIVPVVCYVNSSAAIKSESDICCTSSNAVKVINSLKEKKVIMIPDMNLAKYCQTKIPDKEIIFWQGFCPTHHKLKPKEIEIWKTRFPQAKFIAHPECTPEVLAYAEHICSTSGMYEYVNKSESKEFIIGTEMGILYRLKKENPQKIFHLASPNLICPNMKMTILEDVLFSLENNVNQIMVPPEIALNAKSALDRMLEVN